MMTGDAKQIATVQGGTLEQLEAEFLRNEESYWPFDSETRSLRVQLLALDLRPLAADGAAMGKTWVRSRRTGPCCD